MSPKVSATISFLFVFAIVFILGGWFLMPHLPPVPDRPVHFVELEYWTTNWAGAVLGLFFGGLSARSVIQKARCNATADATQGKS